MAQNHPTVVDEVDMAYASVGMDPAVEPGIGWTGWTSVEDTAAGDIVMAPCLEMTPVPRYHEDQLPGYCQ